MVKKCIATLMDKHYVGNNAFIFNVNHSVIGELDEENNIFTDTNGNEYGIMTSVESLDDYNPSFYNVMELDGFVDIMNGTDLNDAIRKYEEGCKKEIYLFRIKNDLQVFFTNLDLDNIQKEIEDTLAGEDPDIMVDDTDDINQLILDVIDHKFTTAELKKMRDDLKRTTENCEWAIDSIELQIDANISNGLGDDDRDTEEEEEIEADVEDSLFEDKKEEKSRIDLEELYNNVTKTLVAQDDAAKRVIIEIARKELDERKKKQGILLTGPSGVGKTLLMKLIAKYIDRPFLEVDANQLTIAGFVGKDIEQVLWDLYVQCGRNVKKAESAIIFIDEIDKKGMMRKDDPSGGMIHSLLKFIEGQTYDACRDPKTSPEIVKIDTSNMIVIFGGAFTNVYNKPAQKKAIGFSREQVDTKPPVITNKDFVERGSMTDEFMGRVNVVKLNDLSADDIKRILLESDESAIRIEEKTFENLGVKLTFTDDYINTIATTAYNNQTGARGINKVVDDSTALAFADAYVNGSKYSEMIIDKETIDNPKVYKIIKKDTHTPATMNANNN